MNAKTARKLRQHAAMIAPLEKRDDAVKALKILVNKGFTKIEK